MNLEEQIRVINNPQEFVDLCNTIFTEKYGNDFQIIDGTRADDGNDGYVYSEKRIFAIYCPVKPENKRDEDFKKKIGGDLNKAKELQDTGKLEVKKWTFITPCKLSNGVISYLVEKAKEFNLEANQIESAFLAGELYKHQHLLSKFPRLHISQIEPKLDEILKELRGSKDIVELPNKPYTQKNEKPSEDLKKVFKILSIEQAEKSKSELKIIFYKTSDKIAQVNAILGLLKWFNPLEDSDEDMIDWCDQGMKIAETLKDKGLRAIFLSNKAFYLSQIWSREDMNTAYTLKAGNLIGIQVISSEEIQRKVKMLHDLETQFLSAFKEALDITIEIKNGYLIAQILLNIGQAAGVRYIHLNALRIGRAEQEKRLSKEALLQARNLYSSMGYELGVGYALHNLANQLFIFGEKEEAMQLNKTVAEIAKKHNDESLLQTASWLRESLETDRIPDYIHGERRERKR